MIDKLRTLLGCLVALVLFAGCDPRFDLNLDKEDYVTYQTGGGELGAPWMEVTFMGDGSVNHRNTSRIETTATYRLSPKDTKKFFQSLVDIGLFDLRNKDALGGDIPMTVITASVDGRNRQASWGLITDEDVDKRYTMINKLINDTVATLGIEDH